MFYVLLPFMYRIHFIANGKIPSVKEKDRDITWRGGARFTW